MKKSILISTLMALFVFLAHGQVPQSFKYQAVARDNMGDLLKNQNINIRITVIDSAAGGANIYSEVHKTGTNQFGLFSVEIGRGITSGNFSNIPWATGNKWMQVEMDPSGGTSFTLMGTSELISVPYALFAANADNVDDADANPTNEYNTGFSFNSSNNELTITDGGNSFTVDLSSLAGASLTSGTGIDISGNTISNTGDLDSTNEYNMAFSFDTSNYELTITDAGTSYTVDLSPLQSGGLSAGTGIAISAGMITNTGDLDSTNELNQSLMLDTANQQLSITDAGGTLTIDVSPLFGGGGADNDWTINGNDIYNNNTGNVGIGNATPSEALDVTGNLQFSGSLQPGGDAGTTGQFLISQGPGTTPQWQTVSAADDGDWTVNGNDMYNANTGNVGIGTSTPLVKLHVSDDSGVLFTGTHGSGSIPVEGTGTRLMWYPGKGAFRAGRVSGAPGNQWDNINVGDYSVAMGFNTKANAPNSVAMGISTTASGTAATAFGATTSAFGDRAFSAGSFSIAVGHNSTAFGQQTIANSVNTLAGGFQSNATGTESVALGYITTTDGKAAFAIGNRTDASGDYTTALGSYASTDNKRGSFVYGDNSTTTVMKADSINRFMVRAAGGTVFYSDSGLTAGVILPAGQSMWSTVSDVNKKENFKPVNGEMILDKIADFELTSWNYIGQDPKKFRHYGPMAQDFYAAFGRDEVGIIGSSKWINVADFQGINFTAIQALEKRTREQKELIEQLRSENDLLKQRLSKIEEQIGRANPSVAPE